MAEKNIMSGGQVFASPAQASRAAQSATTNIIGNLERELKQLPPGAIHRDRVEKLLNYLKNPGGYTDPDLIVVKNISDRPILVNGRMTVNPGETARMFTFEFQAMRRFFEKVEQPGAGDPAGAPLALIALLFSLFLGFSHAVKAQPVTIYGNKGAYQVQAIDGISGGTNQFLGTNLYSAPVITTNSQLVSTPVQTNGTQVFVVSTNFQYTTNIPGLISLVNFDEADLTISFEPSNQLGTIGLASFGGSTSDDLVNWQSNAVTGTLQGTAAQDTTNISLTGFTHGYFRLDYVTFNGGGTNILTNAFAELTTKTSRTGP